MKGPIVFSKNKILETIIAKVQCFEKHMVVIATNILAKMLFWNYKGSLY